ncbi:TonB-dependent receptor [alpha proteobacterium AAP38]|uniref:TonB-dependent receptor n=1 Tax=Niveispirillum sp. TaxID=1917217 RepID=UPI0006B96FFA|nr:TonB-dependent receptor [alpha proteobacterium AAP38]
MSGSKVRKGICRGASLIALTALFPVQAALAQTADNGGQLEEIIVTGIRAQVQSAQAIKQNAEQLVDSVTAVDIGALPDRSVTEVLQRIPGITIGRTANGRDADRLSIEGSGVQIRGLSLVRGEFNGRDSFGANNGRALGFEDVPPELMAGVDVYKNPSADLIEGGLGGVVNLRTRTPFDAKGRILAGSVDYSYTDLRKEAKPSGSVLYSDRWESNKLGEFGVLFDVAYSELSTRADTFSVNAYRERVGADPNATNKPGNYIAGVAPGKTVYVPDGWGYRTLDFERERFGVAGVVQWRPDARWDITAQYLRSAAEQAALEHVVGLNTGSANGPAAGTSFTYDDRGYFIKGTIANQADGKGTTQDIDLLDARWNRRYSTTEDASLNIKFNPNDRWSFSGDVQYVKSKTKAIDFTLFNQMPSGTAVPASTLDLSGGLPKVTLSIADSYRNNPANYYYNAAMDNHQRNQADQWAERFDTEYTFDDDWLSSARFGVRHNKREAVTRDSNYNWGWISQNWTGAGLATLDKAGSKVPYYSYGDDDFMRGAIQLPGNFLVPDGRLAKDYVKGAAAVRSIQLEPDWATGWRPFNGDYEAQTGGGGGVNRQSEETWAAYGLIRFTNQVKLFGEDKDVDGNIGLRYVHTETKGQGFSVVQSATGININPNSALADDLRFLNGARSSLEGGRTYDYFLPSLNVRVKLTDELQWRFAAGSSIVRPDLQQLQATANISADGGHLVGNTCQSGAGPGDVTDCVYQFKGSAGNPDLKPLRSNQFDTSLEWYFAPTGSLTGVVFYKDIYDFITNTLQTVKFTNNGVTRDVFATRPYNAGKGSIKGFELAYSQFYDFLPDPFSGLGLQANITHIESKGTRNAAVNPFDANQQANVQGSTNLPLEGMSKWSYNIQGLYEKGPISLRLAWNWRERYLLTTTAANINIPAWADDYGQLDASAFFTINDHIKAGVEAANLSNSRTKVLVGFPGKLTMHNWVDADRRYTFVLRANY